jgi:hypothetical protein
MTLMSLRNFHRFFAVIAFAFIAIHLVNHLCMISSIQMHIDFMKAARTIYRMPGIEMVILLSIFLQVASGVLLVLKNRHESRNLVAKIQKISGLYIGFFLLIHVSAVLYGRNVYGLDTNFYFAAAGANIFPYQLFFIPYYFLSIVAFFTHLGCALYWLLERVGGGVGQIILVALVVSGCLVSTVLTLALVGRLHNFEIPIEYKAQFEYRD